MADTLAGFIASCDAWLVAVEELAAGVARGIAIEAFERMLPISPQYSGDYVRNWNVSVDAPDESYISSASYSKTVRVPNAIGGDQAAQSDARAKAVGKADSFHLGQTIYITNWSRHDEFYAPLIENRQIKFRPGNSGAVAATVMQMMTAKARALSTGEAQALAARRF